MRGLEAAALTLALYVLVQAAIFHYVKVSRRAVLLVVLWIVSLPVYAHVFNVLPDDSKIWPSLLSAPSDRLTFLDGCLLYCFLFLTYAVFIYTAESSVSIRTMIELTVEPDKGMTIQELTRRYSYDWMLERRLRRLIHAGYLVERGGWLSTTARARAVLALLRGGNKLLNLS